MFLSGSLLSPPIQTPIPSLPWVCAASLLPRAATLGRTAPCVALRRRLEVWAMDAAQPFDYETQASSLLERRSVLKIAIVGFGNFGQFLARTFARQGHTLLAYSRSDYFEAAHSLGVTFFRDPHDLCKEHPDVIVLCTSILSTSAVLFALPLQCLRRSTLFVDVLSIKEFSKNLCHAPLYLVWVLGRDLPHASYMRSESHHKHNNN